jgi:hypothetical protein
MKTARLDTNSRALFQFSCRKRHCLIGVLNVVENEVVLLHLLIPFYSVRKMKESLADLYAKGLKESVVTYMGRW